MPARIALGDHSPIESTGYDRARRRTRRGRKAEQWRARARFRVLDGTVVEVTRWAPIRSDAEHAVQTALDDLARASADTPLRPGLAFLEAGRFWLQQIQRPEYDLAQRTKQDYQRAFNRYLAIESSPFRALTLAQANDVQRVVGYLQRIADKHGSGAAKLTRTVLSSIFALAVQRGVLEVNAARVGGPVKASSPRPSPRDRRRSMTRVERDRVIALADSWARADGVNPRTADKWQTVADLIALMAGTGCRINEARLLKWDDVDLGNGRLQIHGTKSVAADRVVNLPARLTSRLAQRRRVMIAWAPESPASGPVGPYVFGIDPREIRFESWSTFPGDNRPLDQSNLAGAVRKCLDGAGLTWAVPHTFRRTVATMLHQAGIPLSRIADQLGHADPAMTAKVYLGRDAQGDKSDLAALL